VILSPPSSEKHSPQFHFSPSRSATHRGLNSKAPLILPSSLVSSLTKGSVSWKLSKTQGHQQKHPAHDDLVGYGYVAHGLTAARHHREWLARIRAVVDGTTDRRKLLIIAPPGHAKSTWLSLVFPPWYLAGHPSHSVLFLTSSDTAAHQFGTTVRITLAENEQHTKVFPAKDAQPDAARGWSADGLYLQGTPDASKDPAYRAAGYGAAIIGARAHGIILDDPLTQVQAQSAVEQIKAKQYHDMTVDSRLHPGGWEIAIMTRWHDLDLASHLMAKPDFDTLLMPAIGYWGEDTALWPERFPLGWLTAKRQEIGGPYFQAMYQGDPTGLGGQVFKSADWFRPLPVGFDRAKLSRVVQFWDLAYSGKDTADYTAAVTLGIDRESNLYILNVWRGRADDTTHVELMLDKISQQRPGLIGVEEAAYRQAATSDLLNRLYHARMNVGVQAVRVTTDKVFRAQLPAGRAQAGMVYADTTAPWWPEFLAECLSFPLGAHDDQVDALSGAAQLALATIEQKPVAVKFG
jgi:predicted phage terminase large subunit-like protein